MAPKRVMKRASASEPGNNDDNNVPNSQTQLILAALEAAAVEAISASTTPADKHA